MKDMSGREARGWLRADVPVGKPTKWHRARYKWAVQCVATVLRPRFESGELRAFTTADAESTRKGWKPPFFRIEDACVRLFLQSEEEALLVHRCSPSKAERWEWDGDCNGATLLGAASLNMAHDVLAFAKRRGWLATA